MALYTYLVWFYLFTSLVALPPEGCLCMYSSVIYYSIKPHVKKASIIQRSGADRSGPGQHYLWTCLTWLRAESGGLRQAQLTSHDHLL